jgi:hypothetical protein
MGSCLGCGHEYERHLFGGMCFHCDCKKAVYNTTEPVYLRKRDPSEQGKNGTDPGKAKPRGPQRLGNK